MSDQMAKRQRATPTTDLHAKNTSETFREHARIVKGVMNGDQQTMAELYDVIKFHRLRLVSVLQGDWEDKLHDIWISVVRGIQQPGGLKDPERLIGFIDVIVRRSCVDEVKRRIRRRATELPNDYAEYAEWLHDDNHYNPELMYAEVEKIELAEKAMQTLSACDQEILKRFYLQEQEWPRIAEELNMNSHQFRCHKSRAKEKFVTRAKRDLASKKKKIRSAVEQVLKAA